MWDSVDTALEQTLICHVEYGSINLQVHNNESSISNKLYYLICLEMNNAYELQHFIFILEVNICTSRPSDD